MDFSSSDPELDRDKAVLIRHSAIKGAQAAALLTPPAYILNALRTKHYSVNSFLRANAFFVFLAGPPIGAAVAQLRMRSYTTKEEVKQRVQALAVDPWQIQVNDYSYIGAAMGSLFTTAILLRKARMPWLILGGGGLGIAGGVATHVGREWSRSRSALPAGLVDSTSSRR